MQALRPLQDETAALQQQLASAHHEQHRLAQERSCLVQELEDSRSKERRVLKQCEELRSSLEKAETQGREVAQENQSLCHQTTHLQNELGKARTNTSSSSSGVCRAAVGSSDAARVFEAKF